MVLGHSVRIAALVTDPHSDGPERVAAGEEALVDAARRGDLEAFNALVELHQRMLFNLCARMLGDRAAAEDATQDAFISAFRNLGSLRGSRFRPWLLRIGANACTDELRRRRRRPQRSLDATDEEGERLLDPPDAAAGPETQAMRGAERRAIARALQALPADQRLAVVLCDVQGSAYDEIAEVMGTSIGTVKSRIARGRERLRRELAEDREQREGP